MYEIITFDCYGTLIDWETGIAQSFIEAAAQRGVRLEREAVISAYMEIEPLVEAESWRPYREVLTETARRVAGRLGWNITSEEARFLPESLPQWPPFPDTNPALELLSERYSLGILSNVDDDLLATTRRLLAVDFELIVTAEQVHSYKPAPRHFEEALRRAAGRRLLHAAQSYFHDVAPAAALGIPVAWVNRKQEQLPACGAAPLRQVRDLLELARWLES